VKKAVVDTVNLKKDKLLSEPPVFKLKECPFYQENLPDLDSKVSFVKTLMEAGASQGRKSHFYGMLLQYKGSLPLLTTNYHVAWLGI
jgi:hypothetical protein